MSTYKGDSIGLFDPNFAESTLIDPKSVHLLEVAVIVIAQFSTRVCKWLTRRAAMRR